MRLVGVGTFNDLKDIDYAENEKHHGARLSGLEKVGSRATPQRLNELNDERGRGRRRRRRRRKRRWHLTFSFLSGENSSIETTTGMGKRRLVTMESGIAFGSFLIEKSSMVKFDFDGDRRWLTFSRAIELRRISSTRKLLTASTI